MGSMRFIAAAFAGVGNERGVNASKERPGKLVVLAAAFKLWARIAEPKAEPVRLQTGLEF